MFSGSQQPIVKKSHFYLSYIGELWSNQAQGIIQHSEYFQTKLINNAEALSV
ncbi:MAG: hypothetical protein FD166_3426 [Bacteroidetes bacterium]|nr:MAG: hypothetical protein FD166_3426 [Bacteroidota bacterium]